MNGGRQPRCIVLTGPERGPTIEMMRISERERYEIVAAVRTFDPGARVLLFGSRADDAKRGGDIDLLVMSERIGPEQTRRIRRLICDAIGEQKIDILVARDESDPFVALAQSSGVTLG